MKSIVPLGKLGYTGARYHKGYVYDKLRYVVLTINQMSEVNKRQVQAKLKTLTTGPDAMTLPDGKNGWACFPLDMRGRAYILSFRGIEVALFYQRQLTEIAMQPGDRYPEGVMQDPKEAWQRLDFLGLSAEKANFVLGSEHKRLMEENKLMRDRLLTLDELNYSLEKEIKTMQERQKNLNEKIKTFTIRKELKGQKHGKRKR